MDPGVVEMSKNDKPIESGDIFPLPQEQPEKIVPQPEKIIAREEKIVIMNSPEGEEEIIPRAVTIFGSNNIMGHNIFLVNTNAKQEDLETVIKSLPPEFLDKFINAMGSVIKQQNANGDRHEH